MPLYHACIERMRQLVAEHEQHPKLHPIGPNSLDIFQQTLKQVGTHQASQEYFILKTIIVNNLYSVDIMEEATEICKLRLFLKLVAQVTTPQELEPLPDIDFNILAGNTLIGFTSLDEIRQLVTTKLFTFGDTKALLARIEKQAQDIDRDEVNFRKAQTNLGVKTEPGDKAKLLRELEDLREDLNRYLASAYDIDSDKLPNQAEYEEAYAAWQKSHQPFHWWMEYHQIMKNGGFDVVIGNPPWKEYSAVRKAYAIRNYTTKKCGNLYGMCIERSLNLRSSHGLLSFIVQLPLASSSRMISVRNLLKKESSPLSVITFDDRPGKLFEGLQHCRSTIFISRGQGDNSNDVLATTKYQRWATEARSNIFPLLEYATNSGALMHSGQFYKYASNSRGIFI